MPATPTPPEPSVTVACPHCGGSGKIDASKLSLGKMLVMRRNVVGMKVPELAKKSGIAKNVITRIENDKMEVSVPKLIALCKALDCKPGDLVPALA